MLLRTTPVWADDPGRSHYQPFAGEPFFILADRSYGSSENALVRLEVPGRDYSEQSLAAYSGVDVRVYRVPRPLEFLKQQKNLHRIRVDGSYRGEGLANTLALLWDKWYRESRRLWQQLFSAEARRAVTAEAPELKTSKNIDKATMFHNHPQYKRLAGYELIDEFRYPLWQAKPIAAPKGVQLEGSSSEFVASRPGNVMVPIGKHEPGLYLIEAFIGSHRATAVVFVSDTVAITKVASEQMLVWSARRETGAAVADVKVLWTDGTGVLQSGTADARGIATLRRGSPEHTYVIGEDPDGGVFVSENFYYDSEIYDTKLYAVTDRPLYRPGDEVQVKLLGRHFVSARESRAAAAGAVELQVVDPNGTPLLSQRLDFKSDRGGETSFRLPANAAAGGYELQMSYQGSQYGAAFRVAEYIKPHFEIEVLPAKRDFKTGEPVEGRVRLTYPDGKPVKQAELQLSVRAQQVTMVDSDLYYGGQFPVQVEHSVLKTDARGEARFSLPAASEPSRYILSLLANDGAAFRVKTTRELLIERSPSIYRLQAPQRFSAPGQSVTFDIVPVGKASAEPAEWEIIRMENRRRTSGQFAAGSHEWPVQFADSGSYILNVRDARGNLLAATTHWVTGAGVKVAPGTVEIQFDKETYEPGETAEAIITFSEPVEQAMLTLERDQVEKADLMATGGDWVRLTQIAPTQWRASLPVVADYGPNITLSLVYVKHGDYVFQNRGLQVRQAGVDLAFHTAKEVYAPGEEVEVEVTSTVAGKPAPALVTVGVVDEMIYVLQPEIAPAIDQFFYHPRRNNVRTSSSLSFIGYDMADSPVAGAPPRSNYNERGVKVLERPRRDDVDTAAWQPSLQTDALGKAHFRFRMPDSLTRWRITGRAMDARGLVGQHTAYLRSDQGIYAKWTSPGWMRTGDEPVPTLALFNQTEREQAVELVIAAGSQVSRSSHTLRAGANHIALASFKPVPGEPLRVDVIQAGKTLDRLEQPFRVVPRAWSGAHVQAVAVRGASVPLALPADARNLRVSFAQSAASHFARIADDLIDYPYGCIEQTSSRLIPLSLALQSLAQQGGVPPTELVQLLQAQRLRLVRMAAPDASFGWWGAASKSSAFMSAYAYYADWHASRTLGLKLPEEHWKGVLAAYEQYSAQEPLLHRALILWWAGEMGLPVKTLASGLQESVAAALAKGVPAPRQFEVDASPIFVDPGSATGRAMTLLLLDHLARRSQQPLAAAAAGQLKWAEQTLRGTGTPLADALLLMTGRAETSQVEGILANVKAEMPTLDRALTLIWVQKALGGSPAGARPTLSPSGSWQAQGTTLGSQSWRYTGKGVPTQLSVSGTAPAGVVALLRYDSAERDTHSLAVALKRTLYRLDRGPAPLTYMPVPVAANEPLRTDVLYMDQIELASTSPQRYGVLEVPLPPGADVEATTWGISIKYRSRAEPIPMERARHESAPYGYSVAVDQLGGRSVIHHLLRFAQRGRYVLPPARYYRMYQPEHKALEDEGKGGRNWVVE